MTGATIALGQKIEAMWTGQTADFHVLGRWWSVGEVAKEVQVTKKTARKYLELLVSAGVLDRVTDWYGNVGFRYTYRLSTSAYIEHYGGRG